MSLEQLKELKHEHEKLNSFQKDLEHLINRYSLESRSNTQDFLLAEYLVNCLVNYNIIVNARAALKSVMEPNAMVETFDPLDKPVVTRL